MMIRLWFAVDKKSRISECEKRERSKVGRGIMFLHLRSTSCRLMDLEAQPNLEEEMALQSDSG